MGYISLSYSDKMTIGLPVPLMVGVRSVTMARGNRSSCQKPSYVAASLNWHAQWR